MSTAVSAPHAAVIGDDVAYACGLVRRLCTQVGPGELLYVGEWLLGHPVLDPLYPHRESENVVCALRGPGLVRQLLIVSGHHDSAPRTPRWGVLACEWIEGGSP